MEWHREGNRYTLRDDRVITMYGNVQIQTNKLLATVLDRSPKFSVVATVGKTTMNFTDVGDAVEWVEVLCTMTEFN